MVSHVPSELFLVNVSYSMAEGLLVCLGTLTSQAASLVDKLNTYECESQLLIRLFPLSCCHDFNGNHQQPLEHFTLENNQKTCTNSEILGCRPLGDVNLLKLPASVPDEKGLYLSDVLCTSWNCVVDTGVEKGDVVAIWGAGKFPAPPRCCKANKSKQVR